MRIQILGSDPGRTSGLSSSNERCFIFVSGAEPDSKNPIERDDLKIVPRSHAQLFTISFAELREEAPQEIMNNCGEPIRRFNAGLGVKKEQVPKGRPKTC